MSDVVNGYFKMFYPPNWREMEYEPRSIGRQYCRERADRSVSAIFPAMICADGFKMSVQGHFGAYSYPRDDFAETYAQVEVMCADEPLLGDRREPVGDEFIYPYVPVDRVAAVIEKHGGLVTPEEPTNV